MKKVDNSVNKTKIKKVGGTEKAEKGTVTIRRKGNSFEARIRLELKKVMKGVDRNPRLSRSGVTEEIARTRLAQLIVEKYLIKQNSEKIEENIFSEECEENLKGFNEFVNAKEDIVLHKGINSSINFGQFAIIWLNYKKDFVNPSTGKKLSVKTIDAYVYILKKHIIPKFSQYTVQEVTKEIVEDYISSIRQGKQRNAKDTFLMIRQILQYAKKKNLINQIPEFDLKFPRKKRSNKTKSIYLPAERQTVWLDILENDGRAFCELFATLLQTGMRPEEGCGMLMSNILFDDNMIYVENARKDATIYDYNFNIVGHKYIDDKLKTDESYRKIPMSRRLNKMLQKIYNERKTLREKEGKVFEPSKEYVFLNTIGMAYLPERLDKKLKSIIKKYGLEHMTVYGFRRSFATLMSQNGMEKEVLREIMGHADFETTEFYYIYISEERKKEEFEKANKKSLKDKTKKVGYTGKRVVRKRIIKAPVKISA